MKIGKDKWQHFGVCLVASVISPWLAVGKEYGDSKAIGNRWDWQDILADSVGIAVGGVIHAMILYTIVM